MTISTEQVPEQKPADKELNFRQLEQRAMQAERRAQEAERKAQEAERLAKELASKQTQVQDDDDDSSEPYVDQKRLRKQLDKFGQQTMQATQGEIQKAVQMALQEERRQNWMKQNNDFYDVMNHAEKLAQKDPELAETILSMPESFERQKLVYKNIKALGLHLPEQKAQSIQEKVDANRRNPYYQPSGIANAPYASQGDFSPQGQQQAYNKMRELQKKMRLG